MSSNCACGQPAPEAFLCKTCTERLRRALGDLPALIEDLDTTLARQGVIGAQGEGKPTKKDAQPLPQHIGASEVATYLRQTLVWAIKYLTEARGIVELPADNPTSMARWLLKYCDSIRLDPAGHDIAQAIHAVTTHIADVIDLPRERGRFKVGMCPDLPCPGEVWVHLPAEDLGEAATMMCRCCGHVWPTWEWNNTGKRILKRGAA